MLETIGHIIDTIGTIIGNLIETIWLGPWKDGD